jgi:hypothetical protein
MEAFIYFLLGVVASVLINLATPYIQKKLEGTILVSKSKRLKTLKEEFDQTSELYTNASKFTATITGDLIFLLGLLMLVIVMGTLSIFIQAVAIQMPNFQGLDIWVTKFRRKMVCETFHTRCTRQRGYSCILFS